MGVLQDIRERTAGLAASDMLRFLIKERFAGSVIVTASLKSPSIVVLKMVADIDPSTPVIFCHPKPVFRESETYREEIIGRLGLVNTEVVTQSDPMNEKRAYELCERLWNETAGDMGRHREMLHLNDRLAPYRCWIKAAYHDRPDQRSSQRIEIYGGMIVVDALRRRPVEAVDSFMQSHGLPYHPKIRRVKERIPLPEPDAPDVGYHF